MPEETITAQRPYMPSNGTEGAAFTEKWCDQCSRRALDPNAKTQCVYELRALMGEDNEKWYYVDGVPTCLSFRDRKLKKRYPKKQDKRQGSLWDQPTNAADAKRR